MLSEVAPPSGESGGVGGPWWQPGVCGPRIAANAPIDIIVVGYSLQSGPVRTALKQSIHQVHSSTCIHGYRRWKAISLLAHYHTISSGLIPCLVQDLTHRGTFKVARNNLHVEYGDTGSWGRAPIGNVATLAETICHCSSYTLLVTWNMAT